MLQLVTSLSRNVAVYVQGVNGSTSLVQANNKAFKTLKTTIRCTAPNYIPLISKDVKDTMAQQHEKVLEEDEDADVKPILNVRKPVFLDEMKTHIEEYVPSVAQSRLTSLSSIARELPNNVPFDAKIALIQAFQETWSKATIFCFENVKQGTIKLLNQCVEADFSRHDALQKRLL